MDASGVLPRPLLAVQRWACPGTARVQARSGTMNQQMNKMNSDNQFNDGGVLLPEPFTPAIR